MLIFNFYLFLATRAHECIPNIQGVVESLVNIVAFLSRNRIQSIKTNMQQISLDFIDLYSQILSALRSYLGWSPLIRTDAILKPLIENVCYTLMQPESGIQEPKIILLAAGKFVIFFLFSYFKI